MTNVGELLQRKHPAIVTVTPETTLDRAIDVLLRRGVGGVAVVDRAGTLAGFVSERDIIAAVRAAEGDFRHLPVSALMRPAPTCRPADAVNEVMRRMTTDRQRHLVVVEAGRAVGVISVGDIVKYRIEELETETGVLRDYVAARRAV